MMFSNKVTKKHNDIGTCTAEASEGLGLFRESFYQHEKHNSAFDIPEEVIIESKIQEELDNEINAKTSELRLMENSYGHRLCDLIHEGKEVVLKSVMTRLLLESLDLPVDVLECIQGNLFNVVDEYFTDKYPLIESLKDKNFFLNEVVDVCESTSECIARKKMGKCNSLENAPKIKFDLDTDDKITMLDKMKNINFSTISNLIKDKVVKVVGDENKRAKQREELDQKVQDEIDDNNIALKESMMQKFLPFNGFMDVPTQTLFESLMIAETNIMIESVVNIQNNTSEKNRVNLNDEDEDGMPDDINVLIHHNHEIEHDNQGNYREDPDYDDYDDTVDTDKDTDDIDFFNTNAEAKGCCTEGCCGKGCKKSVEEGCCKEGCKNSKETIECNDKNKDILLDDECEDGECCDDELCLDKTPEEIEEGCRVRQAIHRRAKRFKNKIFKKATRESVENNVDMDTVFMEAYTQYTFLEMLNTIGVEEFSHEKEKNMIKENMSKK